MCETQLAGSCCITQGAQPGAPVTTRGAGEAQEEGTRGRISPAVQQKLTRHCKAIIFHLKIEKKEKQPPPHHIQCTGDEI